MKLNPVSQQQGVLHMIFESPSSGNLICWSCHTKTDVIPSERWATDAFACLFWFLSQSSRAQQQTLRCPCFLSTRSMYPQWDGLSGKESTWEKEMFHVKETVSYAASNQTESQVSTCRWSQTCSAGRGCHPADLGWWQWSLLKRPWHRLLRRPGAGRWSVDSIVLALWQTTGCLGVG